MRVPLWALLGAGVVGLIAPDAADAACSWSFNWYCGSSGCARNMGRSTGTVSGFSSADQCEAARGNWRRQSINTGSCERQGQCDAPSAPRASPRGGAVAPGAGAATPDFDADAAYRRAEAERLQQEAETAERLAREKAEQDRRQRQFLADKLDALKSMKGVDFDGGGGDLTLKGGNADLPLKRGTDTLGLKSGGGGTVANPPGDTGGAGGAGGDRPGRFSRGDRFSAPVDLSTKDPAGPLTVESDLARELVPDGQLGKLLAAGDWPPAVKGRIAIGVLDLDRGRPERAAEALGAAAKSAPQDEFLARAAARAAAAAKAPRLRFDPARFAKKLPKEAYAAYVVGWESLEKGDMSGAARLFGRALDARPGDPVLQQLVAETERRRRIRSPSEQQQHEQALARARDYAQGNAALRLGLSAIHWNNVLALNYLDEAGRQMQGLDWEFVRLVKQQVADQTYSAPGSYWTYRYKNQGEAMLDALEYGNGDWSASLRYLQHVGEIQKRNAVVTTAYRELERLSREEIKQ